MLQHHLFRQTRVARHLCRHRVAPLRIEEAAVGQRRNQLVDGERFRFRQHVLQVLLLQFGRQGLLVPGSGGVVGQGQRLAHRPFALQAQPRWRDQDHAVQVHPVRILQLQRQAGHARGAIAFADQELGRGPAPFARDEGLQPVGQVFDVGVHAKEGGAVGFRVEHARKAGVDRVDVDDVGHVQDRMRVVLHAVGLHRIALGVDVEHFRAGVGDMHPHRSRARAAIERQHQRTARLVADVAALVVGVEQRGNDLAVLVPHGLGAGGDLVRHGLALDGDGTVLRYCRFGLQDAVESLGFGGTLGGGSGLAGAFRGGLFLGVDAACRQQQGGEDADACLHLILFL
ncbi:MAG: hypothetical protein K0R43_2695 [Pseudoduganella sp.]|nr:hypothetical protein [Pseudoduganella sp.]